MKAHERQQLDLKGCEAGETTVPIDPIQDPQNYHKWGDCIQNETLSGTFWYVRRSVVRRCVWPVSSKRVLFLIFQLCVFGIGSFTASKKLLVMQDKKSERVVQEFF